MGHPVHTIGVHIDYAPDTEKKIHGENWRKQDLLFGDLILRACYK